MGHLRYSVNMVIWTKVECFHFCETSENRGVWVFLERKEEFNKGKLVRAFNNDGGYMKT